MSTDRMIRINELLRREIAEVLFRIMSESSFDLSAVTVTHVITARNLQQARVLVSIRDHEGEREKMMGMLRRHRGEIQARINKDLILKFTPKLTFELDTSVQKGDHILDIISKIEQDLGPLPEEPPAEDSSGDSEDKTP